MVSLIFFFYPYPLTPYLSLLLFAHFTLHTNKILFNSKLFIYLSTKLSTPSSFLLIYCFFISLQTNSSSSTYLSTNPLTFLNYKQTLDALTLKSILRLHTNIILLVYKQTPCSRLITLPAL